MAELTVFGDSLRKAKNTKSNPTPRKETPILEGDHVLYGRYPQSLVTSIAALRELQMIPLPEDGSCVEWNGEEYAVVEGKYYKVDPIRWIVLRRQGNEALLLAEPLLDQLDFDSGNAPFEESTLCQYLNGDFLACALGGGEDIVPIGGRKVSLLSQEERREAFHLFGYSPCWKAQVSDFASAKGAYRHEEGYGAFWLRDDNPFSKDGEEANAYGNVETSATKNRSICCIRPLIRVRLNEEYVAPKAEKMPETPVDEASALPIAPDGYVYYGKYPQSLVIDEKIIARLKGLRPANGNPYLVLDGREYAMENGDYYSVDPIRWVVAKNEDGKARLVSAYTLECHRFDASLNRYESSDLRLWLNGEFLPQAFPDEAKSFTDFGDGERLTLLSLDDYYDNGLAYPRCCPSTPYAEARGEPNSRNGNSYHYLKTPEGATNDQVHGAFTEWRSRSRADSWKVIFRRGIRPVAEARVAPTLLQGKGFFESDTVEVDNEGTITFGVYPKSEVKRPEFIARIEAAKPDGRGYRLVDGSLYYKTEIPVMDQYGRVTDAVGVHYFAVQAIRWKVIARSETEAWVQSEEVLDCRPFVHKLDKDAKIDYAHSALREFLVREFAPMAFEDTRPILPIDGDLVSILSVEEWKNERLGLCRVTNSYTFGTEYFVDPCRNTEYATCLGAKTECRGGRADHEGSVYWTKTIEYQGEGGYFIKKIDVKYFENQRGNSSLGVRPCLRLRIVDPVIAEQRRKEKEEAERKAAEEEARRQAEEAKRLAEEEARRREEEERERLEKEREEAERLAKEKAEREEAERKERENRAAEEKRIRDFWDTLPDIADLYEAFQAPRLSPDGKTAIFGIYPQRSVGDEIFDMERTEKFLGVDKYVKCADKGICFHGEPYCLEPIEWIVLKKEADLCLLLAKKALELRVFSEPYKGKKPFFHGFYSNNYARSKIRAWLNGEFFAKAFRSPGADRIVAREVDNSAASSDLIEKFAKRVKFFCENTVDRVFLLSTKEAYDLVPASERTPQPTDYLYCMSDALPKGYKVTDWWLRTPMGLAKKGNVAEAVKDGVPTGDDEVTVGFALAVRPAIWVKMPQ